MGLRFSKSVKICKGVRLNISRLGMGLSLGMRGARYNINAKGRRSVTVGIPGTGISYTQSIGSSSYHKSRSNLKTPVRTNSAQKSSSNTSQTNKNAIVKASDGNTYIFTPEDVNRFQEHIAVITGIHKVCEPTIDWEILRDCLPPFDEGTMGPLEYNAKKEFDSLTPKFFEKIGLSSFEERKKKEYIKVSEAHNRDLEDYNLWKYNKYCAIKIMAGDIDAYYEAINSAEPFVELSKLGSDFEFGTDDSNYIEIEFCINEVCPCDKIEFTNSGKVSYKKMSKTEMYDIMQDYVCSMSIRLARELFAILPIDTVIVHAVENQIDKLGQDSKVTILSTMFEKAIFEKTNFSRIDASDYLESFLHNEKFLKTQGFKEVKRITKDEINMRVAPTEESLRAREKEKDIQKLKVEIPWGWRYENREFLEDRDEKMRIASSRIGEVRYSENIDEEIEALKAGIAFFEEYRLECKSKGLLFEKNFDDTHTHCPEKSRKRVYDDVVWKERLEYLETNYEKLCCEREKRKIIREKIILILQEENMIYQKELVKRFNEEESAFVSDIIYKLIQEGIVEKEKKGNYNVLHISKECNC